MSGTSETIDEAVIARLLDRGLPAWAAPMPAPPGDPVDLTIAEIRRVTGRVRRPCSAKEITAALDSLSTTLAALRAA